MCSPRPVPRVAICDDEAEDSGRMISRLSSAFSSRLPTTLSFALFSTTASSSNPSPAQIQRMDTKQFVEATIADNKVAIFSKSYCPYCKRVKELFKTQFPDVKPTVYELDERDDGSDIQEYLYQKTGQRTVPSVFVAQQHIGGSDDTASMLKSGKLAGLVKA
ncbi:thioredoxin-like protein [Crassisporium funariophilum]|nr:thioredoxin-like protein [Crassisporium funariophilum]